MFRDQKLFSANIVSAATPRRGRGALIVAQSDGRIWFAGAQARSSLVRFFESPRATRFLPQPLITWLGSNSDGPIYHVRDRGLQLEVKILEIDASGAICLLLAEETVHGAALPPTLQGLTPREAEVLAFVSGGRSNAEIAQTMQVAVHTIKKHLQNIYTKLHVKNRTAAVSMVKGPQILVIPLREKGVPQGQERKLRLQMAPYPAETSPLERQTGRPFAA